MITDYYSVLLLHSFKQIWLIVLSVCCHLLTHPAQNQTYLHKRIKEEDFSTWFTLRSSSSWLNSENPLNMQWTTQILTPNEGNCCHFHFIDCFKAVEHSLNTSHMSIKQGCCESGRHKNWNVWLVLGFFFFFDGPWLVKCAKAGGSTVVLKSRLNIHCWVLLVLCRWWKQMLTAASVNFQDFLSWQCK